MIAGSVYGDGSNNQYVINTVENVTFVNNVDATQLESGAITGNNLYDAIIFNNPYAEEDNDPANATLIRDFILSARTRLNPGGEIPDGCSRARSIRQ